MRAMLLGTVMVALLSGCGSESASHFSNASTPRDHWETMAPMCAGYPSKEHCDDGDMALFGGLLCASGDARGCDLVRNSQGADGRWWRSPRRNPGNVGRANSFSRDMSLGVFLYLATTRDREAARKWLHWIENNRPCLTTNPFGDGCLVYGPHRFCTDDEDLRCTMTPANWGVMGRVFEALDLPRNALMRLHALADTESLRLKAEQAPPGYELHLAGVEVLLRQTLDATPGAAEDVARRLAERQPDNPYFVFLDRGVMDSERGRLHELCPKSDDVSDARRFQWSWERDTASRAWLESMGWDCLFLDNLLSTAETRS